MHRLFLSYFQFKGPESCEQMAVVTQSASSSSFERGLQTEMAWPQKDIILKSRR